MQTLSPLFKRKYKYCFMLSSLSIEAITDTLHSLHNYSKVYSLRTYIFLTIRVIEDLHNHKFTLFNTVPIEVKNLLQSFRKIYLYHRDQFSNNPH
jgi:hypothetical protein